MTLDPASDLPPLERQPQCKPESSPASELSGDCELRLPNKHARSKILSVSPADAFNLGFPIRPGPELERVYGTFAGAPEAVQVLLVRRLNSLSNDLQIIERRRAPIKALLEAVKGQAEPDAALLGLIEWSEQVYSASLGFAKELRTLREKYYPVSAAAARQIRDRCTADRQGHKFRNHRQVYSKNARALICLVFGLAAALEVKKNLAEIKEPRIKSIGDRLEKFLGARELAPIFEQKALMAQILSYPTPYLGLAKEICRRAAEFDDSSACQFGLTEFEDFDSGLGDSRKVFKSLERERRWGALALNAESKLGAQAEQIGREFLALSQKFEGLWKVDEHRRLESALHNLWRGPLAELNFHARCARRVTAHRAIFATQAADPGTIELCDYLNPLARPRQEASAEPSGFRTTAPKLEVRPYTVSLNRDNNALLLTGANMAGKTATVKGINMAVIDNQAALPICARAATLSLYDQVLTAFPRSVQFGKGQGFLAQGVVAHVEILKAAGPRTLVTIDELPAGTDLKDLEPIAIVLGQDLINSGATVLIDGHLKRVMQELALRTGQTPMQMEMQRRGDVLVPTFRMSPGVAAHSYAIELMESAGFEPHVADLAREYYQQIMGGEKMPPSEEKRTIPAGVVASNHAAAELQALLRAIYQPRDFIFPVSHRYLGAGDSPQAFAGVGVGRLTSEFGFLDRGPVARLEAIASAEEREKRLSLTGFLMAQGREWREELRTCIRQAVSRLSPRLPFLIDVDQVNRSGMLVETSARELADKLTGLEQQDLKETEAFCRKVAESTEAALLELLKDAGAESENGETDLSKWGRTYEGATNSLVSAVIFLDQQLAMAEHNEELHFLAPEILSQSGVFTVKNAMPLDPLAALGGYGEDLFFQNSQPLEIDLDPARPLVVLRGPNSSGKSVALFNLKSLATLALNGRYCPGQVTISDFKVIRSYFGAEGTSYEKSYFLGLLAAQASILKDASPESLIFLDELHGTDYFELAAIQMAIVAEGRRKGATVIIDTNISDGIKQASESLPMDFWKTDFGFDPSRGEIVLDFTISRGEAPCFGRLVAARHMTTAQVRRMEEVARELSQEK